MPRLSLSLFGPFHATVDGHAVSGLHANRVRGLLAFLAVEAHSEQTRRSLAMLLWPEEPDSVALSNLRYTLADLRHALGDVPSPASILAVTRETVRLLPGADWWLDVREFERLCDAPATPVDGQAEAVQLEEAVALYRGPFLEGFALPNNPAFEDWLFWTREQLQRKLVAALHRLVTLYVQAGRYEAAQNAARRQVHLEPLDEQAHRQLIGALAMGGQRSAALRQFESCRRALAQELGVEPMRETVALAETIRSGEFAETAALATQMNGPPGARSSGQSSLEEGAPTSVFVARNHELEELDCHLAGMLKGQGQVVFVTGDAGCGKTALMREFTRRAMAAHPDLVVVGGSCNAATGMGDPYLPFREIVQMLSGDIEAQRAGAAISPDHARRLWSLLPYTVQMLLEHGPNLINLFVPGEALLLRADSLMFGAGEKADRQAQLAQRVQRKVEPAAQQTLLRQSHLCEQVTRLIHGIAERRPLVLVLDDLQWIDDASISLLFHLGRRLAGSRVLLLGAYRSPDIAAGRNAERHPLAAVIHEFQRDFGAIQVDLDQAADRTFLDALLDAEPNLLGDSFRSTLYQHTGGHALFTVELLRALQARGDLVRDAQGRWIEPSGLEWGRIPPRIEAVIAERVERLPRDMQTLLAAASVEGDEFTAEVAARVLGLDQAVVLGLLSGVLDKEHKLVRAHSVTWLEPGNRSLSRYRFQHFLFYEYLYQQMDSIERARLHRLTAEALEQLYGAKAVEIALRLAYHFERAGLAAQAVERLYAAAQQAMQLGADKEAAAALDRGLTLLATLPESAERAQSELRLRLALGRSLATLHGLGDPIRASAVMPAVRLSRQAGDALQSVYALCFQADVYRGQANFEQALELGRHMLAQAESGHDRQTAMLAHYTLGTTFCYSGDLAHARPRLEETLRLYRDEQDSPLTTLFGIDLYAATSIWLAVVLWILGFAEQALRRADQAVSRAMELKEPMAPGVVLAVAIWLWTLGRCGRKVQPWVEALHRLVEEKELEVLRPWDGVHRGWWLAQQGQFIEGVAQMRRSIPDWRSGSAALGMPGLLALMANVCLDAKLYDEGLLVVHEAFDLLEKGFGRISEAELHRLRGGLMLGKGASGSLEAAEASLLKALDVAHAQQALCWELRASMGLARLWRGMGRSEEAHACLAAVYSQFNEGFDTEDLQEAADLLEELSAVRTLNAPAEAPNRLSFAT